MIKSRRILVPVYGKLGATEIARASFWLARYQAAELHLVEVITPPGFFRWLLTPLIRLIMNHSNARLQGARRRAIWSEQLNCDIEELPAPNLILGVVEAAWKTRADTIIVAPDLRREIGDDGMRELKDRLSEINPCLVITIGEGRFARVEPCKKKPLPDYKRVVPIDINKWVV